MKIRNLLGFIGLGFFIVTSCDNRPKLMDTPTSGLITVLVDETYKPLMDSEKMVFEAQYPDAKINLVYKPALDILDQMDNDSFRAYFTAAPVDSNLLRGFYERKKYFPKSIFIAKDAIALIANNNFIESFCVGVIVMRVKSSKPSAKLFIFPIFRIFG